jgi:GH24 family phage-related lysozyme (muramidase)
MKWNKARVGGNLIELKGLTRRRDAEANLYYAEI